MKQGTKVTGPEKNVCFALPPSLVTEMEQAAQAEHISIDDLVKDAVQRRTKSNSWRNLVSYGQERGRKAGYADADVNRLISEARHESDHGR